MEIKKRTLCSLLAVALASTIGCSTINKRIDICDEIKSSATAECIDKYGISSPKNSDQYQDCYEVFEALDYACNKEYDKAVSMLEGISKRHPNENGYNLYLANILVIKKDYKKALTIMQKEYEKNPSQDGLKRDIEDLKKKIK